MGRIGHNLVGEKYGRLLVLELLTIKSANGGKVYKCLCDCGKEVNVASNNLIRATRSCGCLGIEARRKALIPIMTTHGLTGSITNSTYQGMLQRCNNPNSPMYYCYGARGIKVDPLWEESITNFVNDMGLRPSIDHSIDRIDNNLGYYKENCQWILKTDNVRKQNMDRDLQTGRFITRYEE